MSSKPEKSVEMKTAKPAAENTSAKQTEIKPAGQRHGYGKRLAYIIFNLLRYGTLMHQLLGFYAFFHAYFYSYQNPGCSFCEVFNACWDSMLTSPIASMLDVLPLGASVRDIAKISLQPAPVLLTTYKAIFCFEDDMLEIQRAWKLVETIWKVKAETSMIDSITIATSHCKWR